MPGQRDDRDVGRAAADVDHHVARGLGDRHPRADRRRHGFLDEVHFAGLGAVGAVLHGAPLHLRDLRRHPDDDARPHEAAARLRLADEVRQHPLGRLEVGDHAVAHRADGGDVAGRAAQHLLGLVAHGFDLRRQRVDGDDGGLARARCPCRARTRRCSRSRDRWRGRWRRTTRHSGTRWQSPGSPSGIAGSRFDRQDRQALCRAVTVNNRASFCRRPAFEPATKLTHDLQIRQMAWLHRVRGFILHFSFGACHDGVSGRPSGDPAGRLGPGKRSDNVPQLTVEGFGTVDVPQGKRLVLAIEQDAKVDVLHACGGNARCTTCRVEFIDGEPAQMTEAEVDEAPGTWAHRRAPVLPDSVRPRHDRARHQPPEGSGRADPGPTARAEITPPPVWRDEPTSSQPPASLPVP